MSRWLLLLFLYCTSANAWRGIVVTGPTGSAQQNLGGGDFIPANFINVFQTAGLTFTTTSDAGKVDNDEYLTSSPAGNVSISFPSAGTMWSNTSYRLRADAGVTFTGMVFNSVLSSCAATGGVTFTGCSGGTTTVASNGTGGTLTFSTATNQFSMFYSSGGTFAHSGGALSLYRLSDEADFLAGEIFTPEFKTVLKGLNPKTIRPMGWVQKASGNFNGETNWNYRAKLSTFNWAGSRHPLGAWGGTISGTNSYTGSGAPDTPGSWTDGEQYIGTITNANTSGTVTINIAGRGAKTVVSNDGLTALSVGAIAAGSLGTFTYDGILDKVLFNVNGLQASVPIEAQAQLANRVNANLWATIPPWASDNYVTNWANTACSNLGSQFYLYPEYSNEIWNFSFPQTQWAFQRGTTFGFSSPYQSYYGLRVRQIMGNLIPASGCVGHLLRYVEAFQAAGDATTVTYRFNGANLVPGNAAYNSFTGSANYSASPNRPIDVVETIAYAPYGTGTNLCESPDYNCTPTSLNVPFYQALVTAWEASQSATAIALIDNDIRTGTIFSSSAQNSTVTASGTTFTTPTAHGFTANSTVIAFQVTGGTTYSGIAVSTLYRVTSTPTSTTFTMQPYVGGFPSGSNVNAGSAGSGTTTVGISNRQNFVGLASNWYQFAESNAALYDGARPAGMANLRVEQYEGNLEIGGLSSAQCTSLGIVASNCSGSIVAAILAWKNDPSSSATQQAYFNQFMGTDSSMPATLGLMPHSRTPSQLILPNVCGGGVLTGAGAYALLSDCLPNSTPYQLYNGFAAFRGLP
jgi:hypothetical protein